MPCEPLITDPFAFPRRPQNRAGLPRIGYRIGRYADFAEAMKRGIDAAPELAAWTHRDADDPGIALIEGAAILGDILTFYQEHYANEAYLRTATWRDSVADLVRLTGYRLAPGIGGRATLAFEARGTVPVTIAKGFAVKADLADVPGPADFETDAELVAWPHLGRFNLYRKRQYAPQLAAGVTSFEIAGGEIKVGDRLLLLPPEPGWTSSGTTLFAQQAPQVVKVKKVTALLGRTLVDVDTALAEAWNQPVAAYKLGRVFSHFGHNAPPVTVTTTPASGAITGSRQDATGFERHIRSDTICGHTSATGALPANLLPLDSEVPDLRIGMTVIVQASVRLATSGARTALSVARRVAAVAGGAMGFGNLNGTTTRLTLDKSLVNHAMPGLPSADVRDYRIHETIGPALTVRPPSHPTSVSFPDGSAALNFWGSAVQARVLAGRRLYLWHADGRAVELNCMNVAGDFVANDPGALRLWPLDFDRAPLPFRPADFDEVAPTVTVHGNLADASQGKTEREAVLGNGDHRADWQTFALPKAPLTYFIDAAGVPAHAPELQVFVGGRLWQRVDALYGRGPDNVYIVREDAEGRSFVQFGDGRTGARLPSGLRNVVAVYRTGSGAHGPVKPGATPTAPARPPGFDKLSLAGIVSGGAAPEAADKARDAAPGKLQGLGRLVSIADYETETLGVPGVVTAVAAWDIHGGVPAVMLRVLLEAGREAEFAEVRKTLAHAQRCRGSDRFALVVEQGLLRFAFADLSYARDPSYRQADVDAAIRAVLGLFGDAANERTGVFGLRARRLGAPEYASRIEGRVQNVPGVLWCRLTALGLFKTVGALPKSPCPYAAVLAANPHELLQLAAQHLTLTEVAEPAAGECA